MHGVWSLGRLSDWFRRRLLPQAQQLFALNLLSFSVSFSSSHSTPPSCLNFLCWLPDFSILPSMPKVQLVFLLPSHYSVLSQWFIFSRVQAHVTDHPLSSFLSPYFLLSFLCFQPIAFSWEWEFKPCLLFRCLLTFSTQVLISKTVLDQRFCIWTLCLVRLNAYCS